METARVFKTAFRQRPDLHSLSAKISTKVRTAHVPHSSGIASTFRFQKFEAIDSFFLFRYVLALEKIIGNLSWRIDIKENWKRKSNGAGGSGPPVSTSLSMSVMFQKLSLLVYRRPRFSWLIKVTKKVAISCT